MPWYSGKGTRCAAHHRPAETNLASQKVHNYDKWEREGLKTEALRRGGATFAGETAPPAAGPITKADLLDRGLIGPGSAQKRQQLLKKLELPEHLTPNAMLETLNLLMSREEFYEQ